MTCCQSLEQYGRMTADHNRPMNELLVSLFDVKFATLVLIVISQREHSTDQNHKVTLSLLFSFRSE